MNRGALIARLACRVHPHVLDALPTDWMRQAVAALDAPRDAADSAAEYYIAIGRAFQLPGDSPPFLPDLTWRVSRRTAKTCPTPGKLR